MLKGRHVAIQDGPYCFSMWGNVGVDPHPNVDVGQPFTCPSAKRIGGSQYDYGNLILIPQGTLCADGNTCDAPIECCAYIRCNAQQPVGNLTVSRVRKGIKK